MRVSHLLKALAKAGRPGHLVGDADAGVVVAPHVEGRWFAVLHGEVLNRVNPEALEGHSTRRRYLNPGGDGLWPAPESTTLGYQYPTGAWRVAPGLCAARYRVTEATVSRVSICAEVDRSRRGMPRDHTAHTEMSVTVSTRFMRVQPARLDQPKVNCTER